ncbi:hypothetical protein NECAME_03541 [Necator americanus]|uniref:Uncharacterized protein n=1 Tax=Necator americanus TaxID=51031 RepID=W2T2N1_NECAM|nr:hypothetical protein NECAME_03541 [Necator americanus]ETN76168.1 hypothetical protein NECAME_03541 [Necator americanus]
MRFWVRYEADKYIQKFPLLGREIRQPEAEVIESHIITQIAKHEDLCSSFSSLYSRPLMVQLPKFEDTKKTAHLGLAGLPSTLKKVVGGVLEV